jgi:hypothetical protein
MLCVCAYPPIVARQRIGKNILIVARQRLDKNPPIVARQGVGRNVTAVTNTHATIEELLGASFSMWPVSFQVRYALNSSQNFLLCIAIGCFSRNFAPEFCRNFLRRYSRYICSANRVPRSTSLTTYIRCMNHKLPCYLISSMPH